MSDSPSVTHSDSFSHPEMSARLPLLASTHFCMDVLLQGSVLDLRSLREVLSHDPCAMLRLFQYAAWTASSPNEVPQGLDECIVALGVVGLRHALAGSPSSWQQQARLQGFASHAITIARTAQLLAGTLSLDEESAFLVGAFHDIGSLSAALLVDGAVTLQLSPEDQLHRLCIEHHVPEFLHDAVLATALGDIHSPWTHVIEAAHQLAEEDSGSMITR